MNVGMLCFRFIDDKMPLPKTTRRKSLDFIQEHITVADKVNVVSIRNVVWHIYVLSRALWQVVSQIAKGSLQVDYKEYRCGVPMVVANVDPMPRFSLGWSVVSASSIRINSISESLTNVSRTVKSLSRLIVSNAQLLSIPSRRKDF